MAFIKWDFRQWTIDLLPSLLRKPIRIAWLTLASEETKQLYDALLTRREDDLFLMKHTGQTASLEHLLNTRIDVLGKPIKIVDAGGVPQFYIGLDGEAKPIDLIAFYERNAATIQYEPVEPFIGEDGTVVTAGQVLWTGDDTTVKEDTIDFTVLVDTIDYNDSAKLERIEYYTNKYKLAGFTYEIKPY